MRDVIGDGWDGSSPPVRGTLWWFGCISVYRRFIPARAGNISERLFKVYASAVHPRPCGEHGASP